MTESDLVYLLGRLGMKKVKARSRWVSCECPWASKNHGGGVDEHPSFAISVGDFPHYKCQACGVKGPLLGLVYRLASYHHNNREYWNKVFQWVVEKSNSLNALKDMPQRDEVIRGATFEDLNFVWGKPDTPEESWLENFRPTEIDDSQIGTTLPSNAVEYLTKDRRLTPATIKAWGLGYWEPRKRVTIPMRDHKGTLVGVSGRSLIKGLKPKFLHTTGFKRDYFLFGEHMIDTQSRIGYVVEGHFDVIYLWQLGYRNPVALMGTFPSKYQAIKLRHFFDKLVVIPDADDAGRPMPKRIKGALPDLPVYYVELPEGKDVDELNVEDLHARIAGATEISS